MKYRVLRIVKDEDILARIGGNEKRLQKFSR